MIIRHATIDDLAAITAVERACFPIAEAASEKSLKDRLVHYPDCFWMMTEDSKVIAFVNGMCTDDSVLTDEMFTDASLHKKDGTWQMIFGVCTLPEYRSQGIASKLLETAIKDTKGRGKNGLVLTCKKALIPYYARFGFVNEGVSISEHGGALWYQMKLKF